tara:strand:+ start:518 stop:727 length:210 start_codon:yes stop_codon:yes gene_type:complete
VKLGFWTDAELQYMTDNYEYQSVSRTVTYLGRPYASVRRKGDAMGLSVGGFNRDYINGTLADLQRQWAV